MKVEVFILVYIYIYIYIYIYNIELLHVLIFLSSNSPASFDMDVYGFSYDPPHECDMLE